LIKKTKPHKIYLVDPWWKLNGEYFPSWPDNYNNNKPLSTQEAYSTTKESVKKWIEKDIAKVVVEKDLDFLASLEDNHLDWVYIDSTHQYEHTRKELNRVIKADGIISGHNWRPDPNHRHHGVFKAVNEFCKAENWEIFSIDKKFVQWAIRRKTI
jgi:hypothetical protein